MSKSQRKTIFIIFFDIKGVIHFEFIAQGQTVNQVYYVLILKHCVKLYIEKGLNFGPAIGFPTMTVLQLTRHSLSTSFLPKN
jgi:hypothetical protein